MFFELLDEITFTETTMGLNVEIIMKDNHTLSSNPKNIQRWVEIAREEINRRYQK